MEKVKLWVTRELRVAEERTISEARKEYAMYLRDEKQNGTFFAAVDIDTGC